jgi:hypothetical protein
MATEGLRARDLADFSLGIGDHESTIKYLEQALIDGDPTMVLIGSFHEYNPLRKDPRFIRIIEQLGVPNGLQ